MISQITGTVEHYSENTLILSVSGLSYEIYIPTAVMRSFDGQLVADTQVSLIT